MEDLFWRIVRWRGRTERGDWSNTWRTSQRINIRTWNPTTKSGRSESDKKNLKNNKSLGEDGLTAVLIQYIWRWWFNKIHKKSFGKDLGAKTNIPQESKEAVLHPLFKRETAMSIRKKQ